jgi:hypothetical protein
MSGQVQFTRPTNYLFNDSHFHPTSFAQEEQYKPLWKLLTSEASGQVGSKLPKKFDVARPKARSRKAANVK